MPRPPSKHGLERKYKPWRKGKSSKSSSNGGASTSGGGASSSSTGSSLKHQLRGAERLLKKVVSGNGNDNDEDKNKKRKELEEKIDSLKEQIADRASVEREKDNSKKSHGLRFMERQRLVRMVRSATKTKEELARIALDQIYVAHYPSDLKYIPLFKKGVRVVDDGKHLFKRALTRRNILNSIRKQKKSSNNRVNWIPKSQYDMLPLDKEWTIDMERDTFGKRVKGKITVHGSQTVAAANDDRFGALSKQQELLLETERQITSQLEKKEEELAQKDDEPHDSEPESVGESSSDDDDDDDADPMETMDSLTTTTTTPEQQQPVVTAETIKEDKSSGSSSSSSSNGDDSDSSSSDDDSSDDSDSSSSDDDGDDDDDDELKQPPPPQKQQQQGDDDDDDFDDFLMPATDENVFEKAKSEKMDRFNGDKSQGWATQKQRPGQWKKRRTRN